MIDEQSYLAGEQHAYRTMLRECLRNLPQRDSTGPALVAERHETVQMLREVCAMFGDNDWPDDLYLPDVVEKHLFNHLIDRTHHKA